MVTKYVAGIIEQNDLRKRELFSDYSPLTGIGSPIERTELMVLDKSITLIPKVMLNEQFILDIIDCGSALEYSKKNKIKLSTVLKTLTQLRFSYDFEFWAATCVKIQDKVTKSLVPFILRKPQRKLLNELIRAVYDQKAIRIIILKARQWGGSTLVQIFMAWIQIFHRKAWHSVVVADTEDQARNIRKMYSVLAKNHPENIFKIKFKPFEGSTKNKIIEGRECIHYIGSMAKPDSVRSSDVMMAHLSEVGLWKATLTKKPEDLVQTIAGTVPDNVPCSMIVMESTAKGLGNFFHNEWTKAEQGLSGYEPIFVAWYEIEMYYEEFKDQTSVIDFINGMTDKERYYFSLGATLEGIQWYRHKKYKDGLDDWRMACEFPTTPQEAFQSTGMRAHAAQYIHQMRKYEMPPKYIGDMFADARYGANAIDASLSFKEVNQGSLWLWALPDKALKVKNRYVVSVDIGGRTDGADYSVISVIDRYFMSEGGVEECIATWMGHLDQDLVIWKAAQIAKYFDNALLVVEANSLNKKGEEGDHFLTILDEIKDFYSNLYHRTDPQRIIEGFPKKWGFHTNRASKTDLVTQMNKRYREVGYIERDKRALDEADWYEIKPDGSYGAVLGKHDDIYMSRAIGLKASSLMALPIEIVENKKVRKVKSIRTESSF